MAVGTEKALNYISLAAKAGKIASGGFLCEKALQEQTARYVLIAVDASENTKKKFRDKCTYYGVPYKVVCEKSELGRRVGKDDRTVLAVTDTGLANQIAIHLENDSRETKAL